MKQTYLKKMTPLEIFAYGIGSFGGNIALLFVTTFFVYFCTDSVGLSAGIVGTLILIAKLLDGISDIIMGFLINRTHSRLGKARFWIILCAIPFGLITFLMFHMPAFITGQSRYAYVFITYVLQTAVFYTMWCVATQALMSFCSDFPPDRYKMQSCYTIFNVLPAILMAFLGQQMADHLGWSLTSAIWGFIIFACVLFSGVIIKEIPEEKLKAAQATKVSTIGFIESVRLLITNKYFWLLMLLEAVIYIYTGIQGTAAVYYVNYVLEDYSAFGWLYLALYLPLILFSGFMPKLIAKLGARKANTISSILAAATGCIALIRPDNLLLVCVSLSLMSASSTPSYVTLVPLVAELSDNIKLKKKKDISSMCYAATSAGTKLGMGFGTALAGIFLDLIGYNGLAAAQSPGVISGIKYIFILPPIISWVIMIILYWLLDVTEVNIGLRSQND